jgi:hypothetical protein
VRSNAPPRTKTALIGRRPPSRGLLPRPPRNPYSCSANQWQTRWSSAKSVVVCPLVYLPSSFLGKIVRRLYNCSSPRLSYTLVGFGVFTIARA